MEKLKAEEWEMTTDGSLDFYLAVAMEIEKECVLEY